MCVAECAGGCQNGGTCTLPDVCTCAPGWTGTNCELGKVTCSYNVCSMLCCMIFKTSMSAMEIMSVTIVVLMWMGLIYAHVILAMNCNLITELVKVYITLYMLPTFI